jgi:hypothetical protein
MEMRRFCRAAALTLGLGLASSTLMLAGTLTVRPGVPSVGGLARYTGAHGLEVNVSTPDRNPAFVQSSHPTAESTYRVRFYVNLRSLTLTEGDEFDLFAAYDGTDPVPPTTNGNALVRAVIRRSSGENVLSAFIRTDGGSQTEIPDEIVLENGWRVIELDWAKATAAGANNGRLNLWLDGAAQTGLTGIDNDVAGINYARWGTVSGVDAGTSGTFKLDDFASQRTGYIGPLSVFSDVPTASVNWSYVQALYAAEITSGCTTTTYCPNSNVSREQMAIFLVRAIHSPTFTPPPATGVFADVNTASFQAPYIEQFAADGITSGCATNPLRFCPSDPVLRSQMAVFLLRAKHGSGYTPPPATGTVFADVPAGMQFAAFIEQLAAEGITTGCGGGNYCPTASVNRAQMAIFITRAFSLPIQIVGP